MTRGTFTAKGVSHAIVTLGRPIADGTPLVVWGHGWGTTHQTMLPAARSLEAVASHVLIDFPGFGDSPRPDAVWGTEDYADALADWLATLPRGRRVMVGHSFGGRVALRLAARHPQAVDALVIVAGAGLKRQRGLIERARIGARVRLFRSLKLLDKVGLDTSRYRASFGSADYRNAGAMRPIFVKVVGEDQSDSVTAISCPVTLLYAEKDGEAPPEIGERLSRLIPGSSLTVLKGLDHYSILTDGAPQVAAAVAARLEA